MQCDCLCQGSNPDLMRLYYQDTMLLVITVKKLKALHYSYTNSYPTVIVLKIRHNNVVQCETLHII